MPPSDCLTATPSWVNAPTPSSGVAATNPTRRTPWKVNSRLTLNYGLRYTVIVPYKALWGNMAVFDPTLYNPANAVSVISTGPNAGQVIVGNGDRYNGLVIPGSAFPSSGNGRFPEATESQYNYLFRGGKYPDYYSKIQWDQFQPRLGIAYQMGNKTVLRAGGGRYYTRLGVSDSVFLGRQSAFPANWQCKLRQCRQSRRKLSQRASVDRHNAEPPIQEPGGFQLELYSRNVSSF